MFSYLKKLNSDLFITKPLCKYERPIGNGQIIGGQLDRESVTSPNAPRLRNTNCLPTALQHNLYHRP